MTDNKSLMEQMRLTYRPKLPVTLRCPVRAVEGEPTQSVADQEAIKELFPCTYGMPELTAMIRPCRPRIHSMWVLS